MDFFEQQEKARRDTRLLIIYFSLSVVLVVAMTYFVVAPAVVALHDPWVRRVGLVPILIGTYVRDFLLVFIRPQIVFREIWNPLLFARVAAVTTFVIALGSLVKMRQLAAGGAAVAEILEARPLAPESNEQERKMLDVVQEMAIASGANEPQVFVLDDERGINAFAAGYAAEDMVIVVTRGCLGLLNRDEMQAVVAHEFSHIVNGDTILKLRLTGWVHGILLMDTIGRKLMDRGDAEWNDVSPARVPLIALGAVFRVFGAPGLPFCRLIKSAICRKREWLADAAAIQFTRNSTGLIGALKKIGGLPKHGRLDNPHSETISHLFFASYTYDSWFPFLAAHPPLSKRILAVDSSFDGVFPPCKMLPISRGERERMFDDAVGAILSVERLGAGDVDVYSSKVASLIQGLGEHPGTEANALRSAIETTEGAAALSYSLLGSPSLAPELANYLSSLDDLKKLALLDLALPALRSQKIDAYNAWVKNINERIGAGADKTLFDYTVALILAEVTPANWTVRQTEVLYHDFASVTQDCAVLLSAIAHEAGGEAQEAFERGWKELVNSPVVETLLDAAACDLPAVDSALRHLAHAAAGIKQTVVWCCANAARDKGEMQPNQVLLLRATAETLHCKLPVFAR
jgi:Zn-dependent protease with chaperone function